MKKHATTNENRNMQPSYQRSYISGAKSDASIVESDALIVERRYSKAEYLLQAHLCCEMSKAHLPNSRGRAVGEQNAEDRLEREQDRLLWE